MTRFDVLLIRLESSDHDWGYEGLVDEATLALLSHTPDDPR